MTKEELIKFIDGLVDKLEIEKDSIINFRYSNLLFLKEAMARIQENVEEIKGINLEKLDDYVNMPMDLFNLLFFYQLIVKSNNFQLENDQKEYIKYVFREFNKIMEKKKREKMDCDKDIMDNDVRLYYLARMKKILISKEHNSLDDFIEMSKIANTKDVFAEEDKRNLLENIANYMRYVLIGYDLSNDEIQKGK